MTLDIRPAAAPDGKTAKPVSRRTGKILIVGGYGEVGRAIAGRLAPLFPGRVVVAGRDGRKAARAALQIGAGAEGRAIDLFAPPRPALLEGVALVVVCLDQTGTGFAEACLGRGIGYVDISATYGILSKIEGLDALARKSGATALLSVGVAPGLTNLLAARARDAMERVDQIDILLEFGLGDRHGKAAVEWMFDTLDARYSVREAGRDRQVRSFGESRRLILPGQRRRRPAWRFNFSDQHVLSRNLGVPGVSTWVRFDGALATRAFAAASRAGLGRLLRRRWWRRLAVWLFLNVHLGSDICGVAARATGRAKDGGSEVVVGITGRREGLMTAIVAAETARQALTGDFPAGVLHSEQAVNFDAVLSALRREMPGLRVSV